MNIAFDPLARQEFADVVNWYAEKAGALRAIELRNEIQQALRLICEHPSIGTPFIRSTRRPVVRHYPYSIVYRIDGSHLRILAIASDHRRPGYWAKRG